MAEPKSTPPAKAPRSRKKTAASPAEQATPLPSNAPNGEAQRPVVDLDAVVSAEERERMIAEAAYFLAEQRGFAGDLAVEDWLAAEAQVDELLRSSGKSPLH